MRLAQIAALLGAVTLALTSCFGGGTTTPLTATGYLVAVKSGPPIFGFVGAPIPIAFTVTEVESDSTTRPASDKQFTVTATAGGGTINGTSSTTLTSANDGTVAFTWLLGQGVGTQSLRGAVSDQHVDVSLSVLPLGISTVEVTFSDSVLPVNRLDQATAILRDSVGRAYTDRPVYWESSNPAVATVRVAPTYCCVSVTTVGPGTTTITATSEGKSGSATLRVTP